MKRRIIQLLASTQLVGVVCGMLLGSIMLPIILKMSIETIVTWSAICIALVYVVFQTGMWAFDKEFEMRHKERVQQFVEEEIEVIEAEDDED